MKKRQKVNPSKVLFLDIDGVLNSNSFFCSKYHDRLKLSKGEQGVMHEPRAIKILGDIYKKTHCRIVMSSTWRSFFFSKNKTSKYLSKPLKKDLKKYNIIIKDKTGWEYDENTAQKYASYIWQEKDGCSQLVLNKNKQPLTEFYERGLQINNWLKKHPEVKQFAILDDDIVDLPLFGEHFIRCNSDVGLTQIEADKVVRLLEDTIAKSP